MKSSSALYSDELYGQCCEHCGTMPYGIMPGSTCHKATVEWVHKQVLCNIRNMVYDTLHKEVGIWGNVVSIVAPSVVSETKSKYVNKRPPYQNFVIRSPIMVLNTLVEHNEAKTNGCHFAYNIFKCIFLMKMYEFQLKFHRSLFIRSN